MQLALELKDGYRETPEETFSRVYRQTRVKARRRPSEVESVRVRWRAYANSISTLRIRDGVMQVGLSEALREAPEGVLEALAEILIGKVLRVRAAAEYRERYRGWVNREETRARLEALRQRNGHKRTSGTQGRRFDLRELFEAMNQRYFGGTMEQVHLAWSRGEARTHLGHWDPAHRTIVLSRFLDRPETPRLAVEYVMFHEMLHVAHPVEFENGRRRVHHRRFKEAEKQFEGLKEARGELRRLCASGFSF